MKKFLIISVILMLISFLANKAFAILSFYDSYDDKFLIYGDMLPPPSPALNGWTHLSFPDGGDYTNYKDGKIFEYDDYVNNISFMQIFDITLYGQNATMPVIDLFIDFDIDHSNYIYIGSVFGGWNGAPGDPEDNFTITCFKNFLLVN